MLFRTLLLASITAPAIGGVPLTITRAQPDLDRWNYPLNATPGSRSAASTFGAVGSEMVFDPNSMQTFTFDQRDAQFLLGFDLAPELASAACDIEDLVVTEAIITVTISNDQNFTYDPTVDAYTSHLMSGEPGATFDTDAGRPIELFGVSYRNGFTQASYMENSFFGALAWEGRNAFPIDFNAMGANRDVSNNVSGSPTGAGPADPFTPTPFAVGTIATSTPGDLVPQNSVVEFVIDVSDPHVQGYLQEALATSELRVMVTSLAPASFGSMDGAFPAFYTKENLFSVGRRATIALTVECQDPASLCPADFDADGDVDLTDFGTFGAAFGSMTGDANYNADADFDSDGDVDLTDFGTFGAEFGRTDC